MTHPNEKFLLEGYAAFVKSRTKDMGSLTMNVLHAAVGCGTEAGELLTTAKKMWIYNQSYLTVQKDGQTNAENLVEEAGDLLFYIQMLCNQLGTNMETLMIANMEKLNKRYPTGYSDAAAAARADKEPAVIGSVNTDFFPQD